jgi:hypothetical protein
VGKIRPGRTSADSAEPTGPFVRCEGRLKAIRITRPRPWSIGRQRCASRPPKNSSNRSPTSLPEMLSADEAGAHGAA